MNNARFSFEERIAYLILLVLGLQAFPILPIGGSSLKIYEVLGFALLIMGHRHGTNAYLKACRLYFVILPIISLLWGWAVMGYPAGYFAKYATDPSIRSLRLNYYLFPLISLFFMFANFSVIKTIVTSDWLYLNLPKILKGIILVGTIISCFSLLAMLGVNIKHLLPMFDTANGDYGGMRSLGFSKEPSTYVLYQTWIVVFIFAMKSYYNRIKWWLLFFVNIISLFFTWSSALVAFALVAAISPFVIFRTSKKIRSLALGVLIILLIFGTGLLAYFNLLETFTQIFSDKLDNFFTPQDHTMDSGGFRQFTSRIGIKIWELSPVFGVGVTMSMYYMYMFENKMGIAVWGETLGPMHFPQNAYSQTLAEMGLLGFIALCIMLFWVIKRLWLYRKKDFFAPYFLFGALCNIAYLSSNATLYSYYIWIFLAFSAGYCRYIEQHAE